MEVHFSPELQAKLDRIATKSRSASNDYVQQLVEFYLDHDEGFGQKVSGSHEQLERGEFLTHAEVGARLKGLFQP